VENKDFDIGAERAVLAGLYQFGAEAYVEIQDIIDESDFHNDQNAIVYRCLRYIIEKDMSIDAPSMASAANALKLQEEITSEDNIRYIKSLKTFNINKDNVFKFAAQVKKLSFVRDIKDETKKVLDNLNKINGTETVDQIIDLVEKPITNVISSESTGEKPVQVGEDILEYIDFLSENPCDVVGIPTGFPRYDKSIGGGFRRKTVNIIAARPKTGKSFLADTMAINIAKEKGIPVLLLDTEMSLDDHRHRILAALSGVELDEIETGRFARNNESKQKVYEAAKLFKDLRYDYVSVAGQPFNVIANHIKRWVLHKVGKHDDGTTKDCLVIYDYLKLMTSDSISVNVQEYQALGFQISELHNICVKLDIPCLSFVQLNRDGETRESTDVVSGSDRIIWLCTSFTIFKRKTEEEMANDGANNGSRKLVPIVSRHGAGLDYGDYINVRFNGEIGLIKELTTRNEALRSDNDRGLLQVGEVDDITLSEINEDQDPF
jgi:replicative DNA helicase